MNTKNLKTLLKEAHETKAAESGLRQEQMEDLFRAAHVEFAKEREAASKGRMWLKGLIPATAFAATACLAILSYHHGANRAEMSAQHEIARLQAELEKTKDIRAEFARLVARYGREKIARMAHSNIDYETAILIAEENYVQNIGNFRAELLAAIKREESGLGEKPYNNRRL